MTELDHDRRLRRAQQGLIEAEMRASRRAIVTKFRHRLRTDATTLASPEFLAVVDRNVLYSAIIVAARSIAGADACDLQIYDPRTGALHIVAQHGFGPEFLEYFDMVEPTVPSACAFALATGDPVFVDDVRMSPIFAGKPTLPVMLAAGTRALQSYPLFDEEGSPLGVLSVHYRSTGRRPGQERLAWAAATALAFLAALGPLRESPMLADITVYGPDQGVTTMVVRGPLDALTAPDLARLVQQTMVDPGSCRTLVIDVRELDFLAVAGARVLFETARASVARGLRCYLVAGPDHYARSILARLEPPPTLHIVDDIRETVEAPL